MQQRRATNPREITYFDLGGKVSYEHPSISNLPLPYVLLDTDHNQPSNHKEESFSSGDKSWFPSISKMDTGEKGEREDVVHPSLINDRHVPTSEDDTEEEDNPPLADNRHSTRISITNTKRKGGGKGSSSTPLCAHRHQDAAPSPLQQEGRQESKPAPPPVKVSNEHGRGGYLFLYLMQTRYFCCHRGPRPDPPPTPTRG